MRTEDAIIRSFGVIAIVTIQFDERGDERVPLKYSILFISRRSL